MTLQSAWYAEKKPECWSCQGSNAGYWSCKTHNIDLYSEALGKLHYTTGINRSSLAYPAEANGRVRVIDSVLGRPFA